MYLKSSLQVCMSLHWQNEVTVLILRSKRILQECLFASNAECKLRDSCKPATLCLCTCNYKRWSASPLFCTSYVGRPERSNNKLKILHHFEKSSTLIHYHLFKIIKVSSFELVAPKD
jgi:hypothetical protein